MFPKYPFPMLGRIERCWLFTFREPVESLAPLVPEPLSPVMRDGFAFWNVVVCEIAGMRPSFAPRALGLRYRHVAYRIYVRHKPENAPPVEGLYFVRSDADSHLIGGAGELLTDFRFHHAGIDIDQTEAHAEIAVGSPDAPARVGIDLLARPELPDGSPFGSLFEAKAALRYKPYAFAPDGHGGVRTLRVVRDEFSWKSKLVAADTDFAFLRGRDAEPEINYQVDPIDYRWERAAIHPAPATSPAPHRAPSPSGA